MDVEEILKAYGDRLGCGEPSSPLLALYDYQPQLTDKLDGLNSRDFSRETVYEIVLWKLNRFPRLTEDLIAAVNGLKGLSFDSLDLARPVLESLLKTKGIQLPMASTILRFRNSRVFQIIDERAYRIVCSDEPSYPSKPYKVTTGYVDTSITIYFAYLRKLKALADRCRCDFTKLDRVLYQLDIELGNTLGRP